MAYRSVYVIGSLREAQRTQANRTEEKRGSMYAEAVYDSMLMFAHVVNRTIELGEDGTPRGNQTLLGSDVLSSALGLTYRGEMGWKGRAGLEVTLVSRQGGQRDHQLQRSEGGLVRDQPDQLRHVRYGDGRHLRHAHEEGGVPEGVPMAFRGRTVGHPQVRIRHVFVPQ